METKGLMMALNIMAGILSSWGLLNSFEILGIIGRVPDFMKIPLNVTENWVVLVVSCLYILIISGITLVKGVQAIRKENFEQQRRELKARREDNNKWQNDFE